VKTRAFSSIAIAAIAASLASTSAVAAEHAVFLNAPASMAAPSAKFAAQFELQLSLPQGQGIARQLIDAGVSQDDAAAAAKLAAGHMGAGAGGCTAKVSIEQTSGVKGFSLMRVQLTTASSQTVIERRDGALTIASDTPTTNSPNLV
jgi:hypothetical protein